MTLRLAVVGASGRVGRALTEACRHDSDCQLVAALVSDVSSALDADAGALAGGGQIGVALSPLSAATLDSVDVLVDFSMPQATLGVLDECKRTGTAVVIGTTGFDESGLSKIRSASESVAVVHAPNMSVGVNVCFKVLDTVARAAGDAYDVEIIEAHHRHKVDAPSGTALRMGEIVANGLGRSLADDAVYSREGHTGERAAGTIGFATVRAGDIVGEHTVMFAGDGERIEISHRSSSRMNYARGALRAAHWVNGEAPGLYDMLDVLGLS